MKDVVCIVTYEAVVILEMKEMVESDDRERGNIY